VEILRNLLLATGTPPEEPDRLLSRLRYDSQQMLSLVEVSDARIVRSWLRWDVLPRLRRQLQGPVDIRAAVGNAKRTLSQIVVSSRPSRRRSSP
jgi:hypothetical protein